jgi:hypothetical protein
MNDQVKPSAAAYQRLARTLARILEARHPGTAWVAREPD